MYNLAMPKDLGWPKYQIQQNEHAMTPLTSASQDYLKAIYELSERHGRATTSQLADSLDVKPASVTGMVQKMAQDDPPLVEYQKHYGVTLTSDGERAALEMVRHHRLLELFLVKVLGYSWDEVHEEAERLEHVISEDMERRIAAVLGNPRWDPHGHPIPNADLEIAPTRGFPMSDLRDGQKAIIRHVADEDPELLRYLGRRGLHPDVEVVVAEYVPFDSNLHIQLADQAEVIVLGERITDAIFVDLISAETL